MFVWLNMKKDVASGMGTILFISSGSSSSFESDGSMNSPMFPTVKIMDSQDIKHFAIFLELYRDDILKSSSAQIIYLHHRLRSSGIHILCLRSLI